MVLAKAYQVMEFEQTPICSFFYIVETLTLKGQFTQNENAVY